MTDASSRSDRPQAKLTAGTTLGARDANLAALTDLSGAWIDRVHERELPRTIVLDMDSSESPTDGEQEGSVWNEATSVAPVTTRCSCSTTSAIWSVVSCGPATPTAPADWRLVLESVIARYSDRGVVLQFRADAAFAKPEIYDLLEQEGIRYAIRLPANQGAAATDQPPADAAGRPAATPPNSLQERLGAAIQT